MPPPGSFRWPKFFRRVCAFQYHIPRLPHPAFPPPPEKFSPSIVPFVFSPLFPSLLAIFLVFLKAAPWLQFYSRIRTLPSTFFHLPLCATFHRPFKPHPDFTICMYSFLINSLAFVASAVSGVPICGSSKIANRAGRITNDSSVSEVLINALHFIEWINNLQRCNSRSRAIILLTPI